MKKRIFIFFFPVFIGLFVFSAFGKEIKKDFNKSFDVRKGAVLHLKNGDGDVTLTKWNRDVVDIQVRYRVEYRSFGFGSDRDFTVDFRQSGNDIYVIGEEKGDLKIGFHSLHRYEYTYKIKAPDYVELDIKGDDGDVRISDWRSDINIVLDDGDVDLRNTNCRRTQVEFEDGEITINDLESELFLDGDDGDVNLSSCILPRSRISLEDGDVSIKDSDGDFEIDLDDGDVRMYRTVAGLVDIRAADGTIDLDVRKGRRLNMDISTDDGDIRVDLERGISAAFSVDTDGGRIRVDIPDVHRYEKRKYSAAGEINDGDGRIRIRSGDGNVSIRETR